MPSAASYTSKIRFAASVKNTKAQLMRGVGNLTQGSIAGCGLDIQYTPINYVKVCECKVNPPFVAPPPPPAQYYITAFAGTGVAGYSGDGGPAIYARLENTIGLAVDSSQNLYIADIGNHCIRKVDVSTGIITTVAGNGTQGNSGDGGLAIYAQLSGPWDVAVDSSGNIYISDMLNNLIRKVNTSGIISTIVSGLNNPRGIACDSTGNLYVADASGVIRKVDTSGTISTIASGVSGRQGLACDSTGNLYIADYIGSVIRKLEISTGTLTLFAGTGARGYSGDEGPALAAELKGPWDVAVDSSGNVYIADTENNCIRKVDTSGIITTIASVSSISGIVVDSNNNIYTATNNPSTKQINKVYLSQVPPPPPPPLVYITSVGFLPNYSNYGISSVYAGHIYIASSNGHIIRRMNVNTGTSEVIAGIPGLPGYTGDGGLAINARLNDPYDVAVDLSGNVYIADKENSCIRKVDSSGVITTLATGPLNQPRGVAVDSVGNVYISDTGNNRVRKVDLSGNVTTIAGNGTYGSSGDGGPAINAGLTTIFGLAVDSVGNVYIVDSDSKRVRKVDLNGIITTIAGSGGNGFSGDGGPASNANFSVIYSVAVDSVGNLYIPDTLNHRIRKVDLNGIVTTIAGTGIYGFSGDGGLGSNANLASPYALALDSLGNIYMTDFTTSIRKLFYVDINSDPPNPAPPQSPIILGASSWSYPLTTSFTTPTIITPTTLVEIILTVNSDVVNNDMAIAFPGQTILLAKLDDLELTVATNIILVPSGRFGLTSNILNVVFQDIINAGSTLNMVINPFFQDIFLDTKNVDTSTDADITLSGSFTFSFATKFVRLTVDVNNIMDRQVIFRFQQGPGIPASNPIFATTSSGGVLPYSFSYIDSSTGYDQISCPSSTFVYGENYIYMEFSNPITVISSTVFYVFPPPSINTLSSTPISGIYSISQSYNDYVYTSSPTTNTIKEVNLTTGEATILYTGSLNEPRGLEIDSSGNLYIADTGNNRIQKVNVDTGTITTLAAGTLNAPYGVEVDSSGNLYIADTGNDRIKKLAANTGTVTTLATGTLSSPVSVAVDSSGSVYIADTGNDRIKKLAANTGTVTTLSAGTLDSPTDIAVDSSGNIYISDSGNNRIQRVDFNGIVTTVAGTGASGGAINNQLGSTTLATDDSGNVYIADIDNNSIQQLYIPSLVAPPPPPPPPPPSGPVLSTYQIYVLTPILTNIKYFESIGVSDSPVLFENLQNFRNISGFDYVTGYILPPYPIIPNAQRILLRPIVESLKQLANSDAQPTTSQSYISYLTQFINIIGFDYFDGFEVPLINPGSDTIGGPILVDTTIDNVISPPYSGHSFITNNEPIQPYNRPTISVIPTLLDLSNTPTTIVETTPIIKTLNLLPGNVIPFDIKIKDNFLFLLGTTNPNYISNMFVFGPEPADSIYRINIETGNVQRFPLGLPLNTTTTTFAVDSSYNIYVALTERIPLNGTKKYTIKRLVNGTFVNIAGTAVPISLVYPSPSGTPPREYNVYNGDNIPATTAQISFSHRPDLQFHNNNLVFIDHQTKRIRKVDLSTNIISTIIGPTRYNIDAYAIDSQGNIWFCTLTDHLDEDSRNLTNIYIYSSSTQQVTVFGTVRNTPDIVVDLNNLKLFPGVSMMFDSNDDLYIAIKDIHIVYKINTQTNKWTIIAGNPNKRLTWQRSVVAGYNGDGGNPTVAQIGNPIKLAMDSYGSLYIVCSGVGSVPFDTEEGVRGSRAINVRGLVRKVYNIGPS